MTLLSVCQDAAAKLNLVRPAVIIGSTDLTAQKLLAIANEAGKQLARYHDWQSLTVSHTFTSLATQEQTGALPSTDFARLVYNAEIWNRTTNQRFYGPTNHRAWSHLVNGGVPGGVGGYWRIIGGQLNVLPVMSAGQTLAFDYISRNWAASSGGTPKAAFTADTDVCSIVATTGETIGEDLLYLEVIWRWRHSLGLPQYAEDMLTCNTEKEKAAGRDRGTGPIRPATSDGYFPPLPGHEVRVS